MDKITITIETKNDAFCDSEYNGDKALERELARILSHIQHGILAEDIPTTIYDINGHKVGKVEIE